MRKLERSSNIPEFISRHAGEIEKICRQHEVSRLEVFGSAVTDSFDETHSDIDLLVEFEWTSEQARWLDIYFDFKGAIERLFGRSVDLVSYRSVRNPYLLASIDANRTLLYAA
jgi:predicted nucleotidyltransferase